MVGGGERPTPLWGKGGTLEEEARYRTQIRSWKSHLFWLMVILALFVLLVFIDLLRQ